MNFIRKSFDVKTRKRNDMVDITNEVARAVKSSGVNAGDVIIYCPHTTAGITINENADPDVVHDLLQTLDKLVPKNNPAYRHSEGNSDSHFKCSMFGCSEQVIVRDGQLDLGRWQGIYFCEFDGPRNRTVILQIRGE